MQWRNHLHGYGLVSITFHWLMTLLIFGLFALGKYMVSLDYYHPWYQAAPDLHRSLGVAVALLLVLRLAWRLANPRPQPMGKIWERRIALWVHRLFYLLTAAVVVAGYLITTADGQPVVVFGRFELPATLHGLENQADIAGQWHDGLAVALVSLAGLHTLAALKHHFIDRDDTLIRMLRPLPPGRSAAPGANDQSLKAIRLADPWKQGRSAAPGANDTHQRKQQEE